MTARKNSRSILGTILRLSFVAGAGGVAFASIAWMIAQSNSLSAGLAASVGTAAPEKYAPHLTPIDYASCSAGQYDLQNTGGSEDVGIRGEGYLKVQLPAALGDGTRNGIGYTRVGMLFENKDGELSVAIGDGLVLLPKIVLPLAAMNVEIAEDGIVDYQMPSGSKPVIAGRIFLTRFAHRQLLKPLGRGIYCQSKLSGEPVVYTPASAGTGSIEQGFLETLPEVVSTPRLGPPMLQGALQETGFAFDVAVQGEGFFRIRSSTPGGSTNGSSARGDGIAYTRSGSMALNETGQLNVNGRLLIPPITLPAGASHIVITQDGSVQYHAQAGSLLSTAGRIRLCRFISPRGLQELGEGMYAQTDASGPACIGDPGTDGLGQLIQGYLEERTEKVLLKVAEKQAVPAGEQKSFIAAGL